MRPAPTLHNSSMRSGKRRSSGNILVITLSVIMATAYFLFLLVDLGVGITNAYRKQAAIEAAALAAAQQLSRIVVNDEYYGYISLSDQVPAGHKLLAQDGQPLPISSINSIVAAARTQLIIANALDNEYMRSLAKRECREAHRAARTLETALQKSLVNNSQEIFKDCQGVKVEPIKAATAAYMGKLTSNDTRPSVSDLTLKLGWANGTGTTITSAPVPLKYASCPENSLENGRYKPSQDYAFAGESFYFAAVGNNASLISPRNFNSPDQLHISSIVMASAPSTLGLMSHEALRTQFEQHASAQPASQSNYPIPGTLVVDLPVGAISDISSFMDLISTKAPSGEQVKLLTPSGGDFPESQTSLVDSSYSSANEAVHAKELICLGLFDWLRTAKNHIDIESLIEALNTESLKLCNSDHRYTRYEIGTKGKVHVLQTQNTPFNSTRVHQSQIFCFAPTSIKTGDGLLTLTFVDHVRNLGSQNGGSHAGQVMQSETINWIELPRYNGSLDLAVSLGRGQSLGLKLKGNKSSLPDGGIANEQAEIETAKGKQLVPQPRKSFYSGGLAVSIQLLPAS